MAHDLKTPGIIRAGFEYQDLVAIETLLDYYRNPERYQWVQVEATDPAFKAVDDVVACLADGRFEVTQVKFAADPDNPESTISWDWLLTHKARGKSLLRHWSDAVGPLVEAGQLAAARLKTDRKPDGEFAKCITGSRVSYRKIPPEIRTLIVDQLGSASTAKRFFDNFDFVHSLPHIEDLDRQLWERVSTDTDPAGWAFFQKQVRLWSITKGLPKPDGKIKHLHLRHAFAVESSRPIAQGFKIPADYQVPDQAFAKAFADRVTSSDGVTVLWAPPGRGKSTFLSKFREEIDASKTICIRHHYFLSLDDKSEARFFFQAIARSFEAQLDELMPDLNMKRQSVGDMLTAASQKAVNDGKRLVIVVDGLDHVWREGQSRQDTEELFNTLLPPLPGVHLVVGTQKIAEQHLPAKLLRAAPLGDWLELPLMNRMAVRGWLGDKQKSGRLNLRTWPHESEIKTLNAVADAFYAISAGLPLHLIYSFEAVARDGEEVYPERVRALPACPSGDIRDYYGSFLPRLSARGRVILHVLAGLDFAPPPFAIAACLGNDDASIIARSEVSHLLDYREFEVRPFHGSLFAYLHDRPEHRATFVDNSLPTLEWLRDKAPEYWRETWLWVTQAKRGDADNLIAMPNRAWAVRYIAAGYPVDDLIAVFDHAERAAFDRFDLAALARLRLVKIRAINGPDFQTDDFSRLWSTAAALNGEAYVAGILREDFASLPAKMLPPLVRMTIPSLRHAVADRAIEELNGRITRSGQNNGVSSDHQDELAAAIVSVVGGAGRVDTKRVLAFCKKAGNPDPLLAAYAQSARLIGDHQSVFSAGRAVRGHELGREVFASLCEEGLAPSSQGKLKGLDLPALRCLAIAKGDTVRGSSAGKDLSSLFSSADGPETRFQIDIKGMAYTTFMSALAEGLQGRSVEKRARIPSYAADSWLAGAIRAFEGLAGWIASRWLQDKQWPRLDELLERFECSADYGRGFDARNRFIAIRLALIEAAFDIVLIGRAISAGYVVDAAALDGARKSDFWLDELWLDQLEKRRVAIHDTAGFTRFAEALGAGTDQQVTVLNERTINWANLAMVALDHGNVADAHVAVGKAAEGIFGYGWRKDTFADEVLDAIEMLIDAGETDLRATLIELAGAYNDITEYTDGDETNHIRGNYYELIARYFPEKIGPMIDDLINGQNWRYVEDLYTKVLSLPLAQTVAGEALMATYIMPTEHAALQSASPGAALLEDLDRKLGRNKANPINRDRHGSSTATDPEPEAEPPKAKDFPPSKLKAFLAERSRLGIYGSPGVGEWITHWKHHGRGREALADLEAVLSETRLHLDIESGLDQAAELAAELDGRSKAFGWLVRAQIVRYGWQVYWTSRQEAEGRLDLVARDYKARWKEFVRETMKPALDMRDTRNGIVVPFTRLIYFLIAVGEPDLARAHADVMISAFKAEIAHLPIKAPSWA